MVQINFISTCAASVVMTIATTTAQADMTYSNDSGGSLNLYGQFSPSYLWFDDGEDEKSVFADNSHFYSILGLRATQPMDNGKLTFNLETGLGLRTTDSVSQLYTPQGMDWQRTDIRFIDLIYDSGSWGKVYVGQGSMATDFIATSDYNNNFMTTYNGVSDFGGSFLFRTSGGDLSDVSISDVMPNLDGSRLGRVRYDTPILSGFTASIAAGQDILSEDNSDDYYDVALRYGQKFGDTDVKGGIGFSRRDADGGNVDDTVGSVAVKFASGFNIALAAGSRKDDGQYVYGKLGYDTDLVDWGMTSVAVDYYDGSDFVAEGSSSQAVGIGLNQEFDAANSQLYLGYRVFSYDEKDQSYQDANAFLFGMRVRF